MTTGVIKSETVAHIERKIHLTRAGEDAFASTPQLAHDFVVAAAMEAELQRHHPFGKFIGEGVDGRVTALADTDYCVKISGPWTGRKTHETGHAGRGKNLITEMLFMDTLGDILAARDTDIHVPAHLAAFRLPGKSMASLQEKLPHGAHPVATLASEDPAAYSAVSVKLRARLARATRFSFIRFGIGDFNDARADGVHGGNVFLNADFDPDGPMYLIDLIGTRVMRASVVTRTRPSMYPQRVRTLPKLSSLATHT